MLGCATPEKPDPWEGMNRGIFSFNETLDEYVLEPAATGWDFVVPGFAQTGLNNFFLNLRMPTVFANDLLQGKPEAAMFDVFRFLYNSVFGLAGFIDIATMVDIPKNDEDFGQTLGRYGLGHGAYLYLPMIGPTSLRDGVGVYVDWYADPVKYTSFTFPEYIAVVGGRKVNTLSLDKDTYESIIADQIDPYLFIRNAYVQYRRAKVAK